MLKCRDVTELTTDYLEGKLPAATWLGMRWHLFICSMCRAYLDQLRKTMRLLGSGTLPAPDSATEARLLDARGRPPG